MAEPEVDIRILTSQELPEAQELRYRILDQPLGFPPPREPSKADYNPNTVNVGAYKDGCLVGVGRIEPRDDQTYIVRRVATTPELQGKGIGGRIMQRLEEEARARGARTLVLFSRLQARPFYERLGYSYTGKFEPGRDEENPEMVKEL